MPEGTDDTNEQRPAQGQDKEPGTDRSLARELEDEGRAGKGINQAGFLKDDDAAGPDGDRP